MLHKKGIFLTAAFAVPVLCCLIGIGAFVLLTTSMAQHKMPSDPNITQQIKIQENITKTLNDKLAQIKEQICQLHDELKHEEVRVQIAQKIKEMIDSLGSAALNLQENLPFLRQKLAEMQRSAQKLDVLDAKINETSDPEEDFQKTSEHSQQQDVRLSNLVDTNRNPIYRKQEG